MSATTIANSSADPEHGNRSPIGQLLESLGMTREDLTRHSAQMREFLTAESSNSLRALAQSTDSAQPRPLPPQRQRSETPSFTQPSTSSQGQQMVDASSIHSQRPSTPPPALPPAAHAPKPTSNYLSSHQVYDVDFEDERNAANERRERERERRRTLSSASPTRAKPNLDMIMQMRSRESRRVSESEESEDSEEGSMRDMFSGRRRKSQTSPQYRYPHPSSKPAVNGNTSQSQVYYRQESPVVPASGNYYRARDTFKRASLTPQASQLAGHIPQNTTTPNKSSSSYYRQKTKASSAFLSSSPVRHSPFSSSPSFPVNIVSSPGPMDSDPPDPSEPNLPYVLPPGPYTTEKPEISYAALIGRAILASPNHALRLKDIYDYISIVFPYYKRDGHSHGQKWMNAIRQNLTNTPQFFKREHPDGSAKGSLWCIRDEELACFAGGSYNRHALNPFNSQSANAKAERRKRKKDEEKARQEPSKRPRLLPSTQPNPYHFPYGYTQIPIQYPTSYSGTYPGQHVETQVHTDIIFPPLPPNHPNAHLVSVSQTTSETTNKDTIFPPLPAYSQTRMVREQRMQEMAQQEPSLHISRQSSQSSQPPSSDDEQSSVSAPPMSSASSSASTTSIPDLTPNNSSSSPLGPDEDDELHYPDEGNIAIVTDDRNPVNNEQETRTISPTLLDNGKGRATRDSERLAIAAFPRLPPLPSTPTAKRKSPQSMRTQATRIFLGPSIPAGSHNSDEHRPSTPPRPSTPTGARLAVSQKDSPARTPRAQKDPHATPTRNTARFKEPAPVEEYIPGDNDGRPKFLSAIPKTPSRRPTTGSSGEGSSTLPITPRRVFSPYGSFSPFRTPSRRNVFDPTDPSQRLDEELSALAATGQGRGLQDSPIGFFAHGKGLLYESPSMPSPGVWRPW